MNAIGLYLLFVVSFAVMILSDDTFSEQNKNEFLNHLLEFHNMIRRTYSLSELVRNTTMDDEAKRILNEYTLQNKDDSSDTYGMISYVNKYFNTTKLDVDTAKLIFESFYIWRIISGSIEPFNKIIDASIQIVWEHTKEVGMAVGRTDDIYAVVILYSPSYDVSEPSTSA